ncbi:MAG: hypothetical protein AABZ61_04925 [Bacteroidota bacterium]
MVETGQVVFGVAEGERQRSESWERRWLPSQTFAGYWILSRLKLSSFQKLNFDKNILQLRQ